MDLIIMPKYELLRAIYIHVVFLLPVYVVEAQLRFQGRLKQYARSRHPDLRRPNLDNFETC